MEMVGIETDRSDGGVIGRRMAMELIGKVSIEGGRSNETVSRRPAAAIAINRYSMFSPLVCSGKEGANHGSGGVIIEEIELACTTREPRIRVVGVGRICRWPLSVGPLYARCRCPAIQAFTHQALG